MSDHAKEQAHPASAAARPEAHKPEPAKAADPTAGLAEAFRTLAERMPAPGGVAATASLDVTQPGGKYIIKGRAGAPDRLVNSEGRELKEDGTLKHPEQQQVNAFGQLV